MFDSQLVLGRELKSLSLKVLLEMQSWFGEQVGSGRGGQAVLCRLTLGTLSGGVLSAAT